ncbi:hypothetical protein [Paenibacillus xylanexedens]|uniref:hypothetical protein n=1 Tax=Paenibacillus xylanexedens TaxID=528191 RepID=UPI0011AB1CD7|nr:hypothetical protein [Paenibacillus xylanexedens]
MFNEDVIKVYHQNHNEIENVIYQIVSLHGRISDTHYNIETINSIPGGFNVEVSEYIDGWGDDAREIRIPLSMLTNDDEYNELQENAEKSEQERILLKDKKKQEEIEKKLKEAREFIEKHS